MSGGAVEYVAGYMQSSNDKSGFTSSELVTYSKYLDLYPDGTTITSYNNRILGDATGEMGPFYLYADKDGVLRKHNSWYGDWGNFIDNEAVWFHRGNNFSTGILAGQFCVCRDTGQNLPGIGFRLTLSIK